MLDVLVPTFNRSLSLVMTLAGLAAQSYRPYRLVVADQSDRPQIERPEVRSLLRMIEARGNEATYHHRAQVHGIAEQRDFLLRQSQGEHVLYLDDDVFMEPWVIERLEEVISEQECGFVGAFPTGLSFRDDVRPEQQSIEFWQTKVQPEVLEPEGPGWERWQLHRAANLFHVAQRLEKPSLYKVAWVASCVLYNRGMLEQIGGFGFWRELPRFHSGEEVLVQNLLMRRWGGCGIVPSGTYHTELPSTVLNKDGGVDGHALELLPRIVESQRSPTPLQRSQH